MPSGYVHVRCSRAYFETTDILERLQRFAPDLRDEDVKEIEPGTGGPRLRLTFRRDERVPRHSGVDSGAPVASPDGRGRRPSEGAGMRWSLGGWAAAAVLFLAGLAAAGEAARLKKPRLGLRASPRVAFSPIEILAVAELKGGQDIEEFYCPGLEWDWGDGSRSAHESDCAPFQAGTTLDRFFTARHSFRAPGAYTSGSPSVGPTGRSPWPRCRSPSTATRRTARTSEPRRHGAPSDSRTTD